jgi:hypothetical protein
LSFFLNGTIKLQVGNSTTPSWKIINDTGTTITTLSLYFTGALASNSFLDMQINGWSGNAAPFVACTAKTAAGVVTTDPKCGSHDQTAPNPALPTLLTWSPGTGSGFNGTGLLPNEQFDLVTASFAHAGQDAGIFYDVPAPEPEVLEMLAALGGITVLWSALHFLSRQRRPQQVSAVTAQATILSAVHRPPSCSFVPLQPVFLARL